MEQAVLDMLYQKLLDKSELDQDGCLIWKGKDKAVITWDKKRYRLRYIACLYHGVDHGAKKRLSTICGKECLRHDHIFYREMSNICLTANCDKKANYGPKGTTKGYYCVNHKLTDHTCTTQKMCIVCDKKIPLYGTKVNTHCANCRTDNMINHNYKHCTTDGCERLALYGPLYDTLQHCTTHRSQNEYVVRYPKCETCQQPAYFTWGKYPTHCETHKQRDQVDVVLQKCTKCDNKDYFKRGDRLCYVCKDVETFVKLTKRKEDAVQRLLDTMQVLYIRDKSIANGCDRKRPDYLIDCGTHFIVIEVDEFQHRGHGYDCVCEQTRMINIYASLGTEKVVFIRYNPDTFTDSDGKAHKACDRTPLLHEVVNKHRNKIPEPPITIEYMYYDGMQNNVTDSYTVDPYNI